MATRKSARTGPPSEQTSSTAKPQETEKKPSVAAQAAAQIQKAGKGKKAAKATKTANGKSKPTHAKSVSLAAIKAISRHSEKQYKTKQQPMGAIRSPLPAVTSGSLALNNLIGGNPAPDGTGPICAGYPRRHITEIYGPESSGKTTLALEAIASVQKAGGIAMFLDFEHALHHGYAQQIGVDFDPEKLLLYQPNSMEEGLDMAKIGIRLGVDLIVVDSIAAMVPIADMEKNFSESDQIGSRARKLASALPKVVKFLHEPSKFNPEGTALIFINQTRANIGGGTNSGPSTSGGNALKFFAYVRLMVNRIGSEFIEKVDSLTRKKIRIPYGNKTLVKVVKSKVDAKQGQKAEIFIRYGQGIDDYYSAINTGVAHKVIKKEGAYYQYGSHRVQGREKFRNLLMENEALFNEIEEAILKSIRAQTQDIEIDEEEEDLDALLASTVGDGNDDDDSTEAEDIILDEAEL